MTTVLGIEDMFASEHYTEEQLLIYLEYIANILHLLNQVECTPDWSYTKTDIVTATQQNLTSFLDWLNYEAKTFNKQGRVLIVHKNAPATAVAEIVEADLAYQIIQYNHHTLQGDIEAKKTILLALGSELEPKRKLMEARTKTLTDGIFFMLNNLDLRHNNRSKKDKNYKEAMANMRKNKLEQWYDELYQMMLLAFLELEQSDRELKITELKQHVTGGNK